MKFFRHPPRFYLMLGLLFAAATAPLTSAQAQAGSSSDAQTLLQRADEVRNPRQSYRVTSTLIEYRNGKEISRNQLAVFTRYEADTQQFRNLNPLFAAAP